MIIICCMTDVPASACQMDSSVHLCSSLNDWGARKVSGPQRDADDPDGMLPFSEVRNMENHYNKGTLPGRIQIISFSFCSQSKDMWVGWTACPICSQLWVWLIFCLLALWWTGDLHRMFLLFAVSCHRLQPYAHLWPWKKKRHKWIFYKRVLNSNCRSAEVEGVMAAPTDSKLQKMPLLLQNHVAAWWNILLEYVLNK